MIQTTNERPTLIARAATMPAWWQQLALLLLLALAIMASTWAVIATPNLELGDFAANSLLIQDAKSLGLYTGNYSRVGFNHPGPAILYVLAAGEMVFHDWLHIARSPFSGQLMAIALYNAFWMTLIFSTLARMMRSRTAAAVALAVLAAALACLDFQIFSGAWFPHLYLFPFAVMLVTGARLVDGHADALTALALSCGFLMNGHVSFVAILGIVFLTVAAANFFIQRGHPDRIILHKRFLAGQPRPLLRFAAIIVLFLLPLAIETLRRFPGPVADYMAFSGHTKHNSAVQAFKYVGVYWGGTLFSAMLALALAGLLLAYARRAGSDTARSARAVVVAGTGATLGLLFYAKVGIDLLEFAYIGLFYYAVPALAVAIAAACIYNMLELRRKWILATLLMVLCAALTLRLIHKPVDYLPQYNQPEVPQLYEGLRKLEHRGRLVLDLDFAQDQGFIWTNVLGLQAYAKRRHDEFFCVNANWHISNTRAARCTADEVARGTRYRIRKLQPGGEAPLAQGMGLGIYRFDVPNLSVLGEATVAARPELFSGSILGSGWSALESQFVWSEGKLARLTVHLSPNFQGALELDLGSFIPRPEADQLLTVQAGATRSGPHRFVTTEQRKQIRIPVVAGADGVVQVELQIDHPVSPKQAGMSEDARILGVSLYGIKVIRQ